MEYKIYPDNFFELADALSNYESSKVSVLMVPYEKTTTFVQGTKNGPKAMMEASQCIQLYDEELEENNCDVGICTLNFLESEEEPKLMIDKIYETVKKLISDEKFPVMIGGEHSITHGSVKALAEKYENLSVLQIDAHTDLVDEWEGTKYNHACVGRRCFDITKKLVQVGIRSVELDEVEFAKENNIKIFWAKDIVENDNWFDDAISSLSEDVYITLDLDGLDPSIMPSVGTPEPGGFGYYQILRFLSKVCKEKNVVGFDVVELCPREEAIHADVTAAKLVYKLIGYCFSEKE